jgi:hypothetical protein
MYISAGSIIPAFRRHVTVFFIGTTVRIPHIQHILYALAQWVKYDTETSHFIQDTKQWQSLHLITYEIKSYVYNIFN